MKESMKTSLDHLPADKRRDIEHIVKVIRERHDPEMIILYGSFARGDWVSDRQWVGRAMYEYLSDYDIYVLTRLAKQAKKVEHDSAMRNLLSGQLKHPSSVIADTVKHFNSSLEKGRYFYVDITKEGVLLFDSGKFEFSEPRKLTTEERVEEAEINFKEWMPKAEEFLDSAETDLEKGKLNISAFLLFQSAEHCTTTALLVLSNYKPKGHNLSERLRRCIQLEPRFTEIFNFDDAEEKRLFDLLCESYIASRYTKGWEISRDDLESLSSHVAALRDLTREVCEAQIESLKHG
jgi:HEPN domain-containing protein